MKNSYRFIIRQDYTNMSFTNEHKYRSWVEVDLDNFTANLREIKRLAGGKADFLQTVKADAYGHGAIEISRAALREGARMLGVANADEGIQLREAASKPR